jgi:hypothetical protein
VRTHLSISARARRWKFLAAAASVGVVAAALTCPGAAVASTATAPPGTAGSGSPSAAVGLFASQVETLGVEQFPATFAGATLEPSGVTVVYAVASSDAGLVSAVQALNTQGYPVQVVAVSRSYSQLNAIADKLFRAYSHLRAMGINLSEFGPDPASGTVTVTMDEPTASNMSALASAQGAAITSFNYRDEASAVLEQQAGAGITLQSQYAAYSFAPVARDSDTPPYYDGDQIYHVALGTTCTSGFNMVGSAGNDYMITAGHCHSGTWKTHAATMGNTTHNYFTATSGNDFQTTGIGPSGGLGVTWTNGANHAPVSGALFPAVGVPISFNGSWTGEHRNIYVLKTNDTECTKATFPETGNQPYCLTNLTLGWDKTGNVVCEGGDSGGPVYQHTSGTDVKAVGMIVFSSRDQNGNYGPYCSATQIDHIAFITHTTLITNP